jgi:hypothetical protein
VFDRTTSFFHAEHKMKKMFVNVWFLAIAVMVSFSWLSISQYVRSGTTGDFIFVALTLFVFVILRMSSGLLKRLVVFLSVLSIGSGLLTFFWPAQVDWPDFVPDFLRVAPPSSDSQLFLVCFLALLVLTLVLPPVRRLLGAQQRGR